MTRQRWEKKTLVNVVVCRHNVDLVLMVLLDFSMNNHIYIVDMVLCAHLKPFCCFCTQNKMTLYCVFAHRTQMFEKWDYSICAIYQYNVVQFHLLRVGLP